jgi:hypothetical protein
LSVYVDPLLYHGGSKEFKYTVSCHMYADTPEELHAMALLIGMRLEWFQNRPDFPHYDLTPARRKRAVHRGAVQVNKYHVVNYARAKRGLPPLTKRRVYEGPTCLQP